MGRKRAGPVRMNGGDTYYARLHIRQEDRERAGKTRLIRSLETTNHNTALKRYGLVIEALERELEGLLSGETLRSRIDTWSDKGVGLSPAERAEGVLGVRELDQEDPLHEAVYTAIATGKELPLSWDELLELWVADRNRRKARDLAPNSIASAKTAIKEIQKLCTPSQLNKEIIQQYIDNHTGKPTTIQTRCGMLSAIYQVGIYADKIDGINPFSQVRYSAAIKTADKRKAFTDEQLRELAKGDSKVLWLVLSAMRPGEYCSRDLKDIEGGVCSVMDKPEKSWRTKNIASIRRVPVPPGFELMDELRVPTLMLYLQRDVKKRFSDKRLTPHSGRHTFYELSRRAGCDPVVIEAITGHAAKRMSSQYGSFPDAVLIREAQKVWDFVDQILR